MKKTILLCMVMLAVGFSITGCGKTEEEKRRAQQEEQAKKFFDEELTSTDRDHGF
ncbi:hypothetical protein [Bartonella tribocorum]|uniref:hypothetical protein n=1 Tax=Bartonella tribocorum TaxID=85701 RepID=UPI00030CEB83|nr:hypothetical protein [Bartonella tribocorum]CDO49488.1 hypothetical protein BM1374166_01842 [Bartonella tribocorum]